MTQQAPSRLAELTTELLGAQAAAGIVEKIWNEASPEVRAAMADAVIGMLLSRATHPSGSLEWDINTAIKDKVSKLVNDHFDSALAEEVRKRIEQRMAQVMGDVILAAVDDVVRVQMRNLAEEIGKRVERAIFYRTR